MSQRNQNLLHPVTFLTEKNGKTCIAIFLYAYIEYGGTLNVTVNKAFVSGCLPTCFLRNTISCFDVPCMIITCSVIP